jgi:hypothetical protein
MSTIAGSRPRATGAVLLGSYPYRIHKANPGLSNVRRFGGAVRVMDPTAAVERSRRGAAVDLVAAGLRRRQEQAWVAHRAERHLGPRTTERAVASSTGRTGRSCRGPHLRAPQGRPRIPQ